MNHISLNRRQALKSAAAGMALLAVPVTLRAATRQSDDTARAVNAFVAVRGDGRVVLQSPFAEMGQGATTMVVQVLADELDVPLEQVIVEQAPPGADYRVVEFAGRKLRITGGSMSTRLSIAPLRQAGATARTMLVEAAADQWHVPAGECRAELGYAVHTPTGRKLAYKDLAAIAAARPIPQTVALKPDSELRYIGKPVKRIDTADKINGKAVFGIDARAPNMACAAIRRSPVFGGEAAAVNAAAALKLPGVIAVEKVPGGVVAVADNFWRAKTALEQVEITWNNGPVEGFSSAGFIARSAARLDESGLQVELRGKGKAALAGAARVITADYGAPFLSHAMMEPVNATADVRADGATVWCGNQNADAVVMVVQAATRLPPEKIAVNTTFLGGGFGRRSNVEDFVLPAVLMSQKLKRPVKLVYSREEDMQHDFYRPATVARLRAAFDKKGRPIATHFTLAGDGPMRLMFGGLKLDESAYGGLENQPYGVPNVQVDYVLEECAAPLGFWRSVGHSHAAFYKECFIDEMAAAAGQDELTFRRALLTSDRCRAALDKAVAMANFQPRPYAGPDGGKRAMGLAVHDAFGSVVAQVAEVSIVDGAPRVHRVWAVVDCGRAVNPRQIEAQMQSGIVYGLSAAMHEEITITGGKVDQGNFTDYPVLSPAEMPVVETAIIESGAPIGGIGEVGTPPIAPAVANALAKLTGKRIRNLPFSREKLQTI